MLNLIARRSTLVSLPKAGLQAAIASLLLIAGAGSVHDATASNETRTLSFHHTHSGEDLTITFKREGRYDDEALKTLNHFLRDWRTQDQTTMDRHLFDIIWEVYRDVDGKRPIQIVSAYRSPATNAMLRRRSSGVARASQHMRGHAMDFFIPGVPLADIRAAGLRLQRGGVGFYPTSGSPFVHLDTGSIRHWPRMSREELAQLFPDGRTAYIPADGHPMPGYELALADIARHKDFSDDTGSSKPSLLALLFGTKQAAEDDDDADEAPATETQAVAAVHTDPTPLPRSRPAGIQPATYQVASANSVDVPAPAARASRNDARADTVAVAHPTAPTDIINARGFWGDEPQAQAKPQPAVAARRAVAAVVDPQSTSSLPGSNETQTNASANNALAYAPATLIDRSKIVASSGPMPRPRATPAAVADSPQTPTAKVASVGPVVGPWLRVMMLSPNATTVMSATAFGQADIRAVRTLFVKPERAIAMTFCDDPQMGIVSDRFSGPAVASLPIVRFLTQTASLR